MSRLHVLTHQCYVGNRRSEKMRGKDKEYFTFGELWAEAFMVLLKHETRQRQDEIIKSLYGLIETDIPQLGAYV